MKRQLIERARAFRRNPTRGERTLWEAFRGRSLGVRIYRQQPIGVFITDFACERPRLIIEVDGPVHDLTPERDQERQRYLEDRGYRVLRVSADEAEHRPADVVDRVTRRITELRPPTDRG